MEVTSDVTCLVLPKGEVSSRSPPHTRHDWAVGKGLKSLFLGILLLKRLTELVIPELRWDGHDLSTKSFVWWRGTSSRCCRRRWDGRTNMVLYSRSL